MIKKGLSGLVFFFLYLISLLPFWLLYLLADLIYLILYHITGYRRETVSSNLRNSFPEKDENELKTIEKRYYKYMADLIVETIKMLTISEKEVLRRMPLTNPELVEKYCKEGRSMFAAVGHYCNWELCVLRFSLIPQYKKIMVYKPLNNKESDNYYQKMRGRFGVLLVPMRNTLRKLVELKNELTFTVLASDQAPVKHEAQYFTRFLNQPTAFFMGAEKMGIMFDSVVLFGDVKYLKRGYYEYTFVPLAENPKQTAPNEITELYVKHLEDMIKREPAYWLWSHRRWKYKPEDLNR
ncbi:lysophospholipid acyltransferase family protein [uncultured Mucilaginibacter sp.]|uniref:lysophospholipid acyltransferase family protein n=1 Tax=uncultured Mucilaginibacter sp. TaxID=797541 RepID=UPI0025F060FE|nr:lysophospholipid acyltransferase family protein [uncultured Mucilaginibacter sp.]